MHVRACVCVCLCEGGGKGGSSQKSGWGRGDRASRGAVGGCKRCLFRKRDTGRGAGEESQKAQGPPDEPCRYQPSSHRCPSGPANAAFTAVCLGGLPSRPSSVVPNAGVTVALLMEEVDSEEAGE